MKHDHLRIEIDGSEVEELYADLVSLEVELDNELAGMFRIDLALLLGTDGTWPYVDDERFALWHRVVVTAGLEDDFTQLISGYITHLRPHLGSRLDQCRLEIWGMDASVLMDRVDRLKDWPNKKDSDIAAEVFEAYGLTPDVTDTEVVHDELVSTIIQRETDIQLLRRLALRNGFECFVEADRGCFRPPPTDGATQPVLAVHFGEETNVDQIQLEANALVPVDAVMTQLDHVSGKMLQARSENGRRPILGAEPAASLKTPRDEAGLLCVTRAVTTGAAEMSALCQGLHDRSEWFVTAEGDVAANEYGTVLMPRATVLIKGAGEAYSGVYYVTHVTHRFTADGYTQSFRAKRNALRPKGDEVFSGEGGGLLAVLTGGI
ncbi:contractile injection system protein, VgrG/Pvc8 family [Streptomyces sp. NPDC046727]|uniref:phage late control D family protein n=1 Tax=Streptomyces sp. NPDC046727 TaxID=3155373 RepID=UPI0033EB4322